MGGRFSAQWQRCPLLRSPLCQILFTCFPRTSACTHCSQQHRASALGTSLAETVRFQEQTQKSWAGSFRKVSRSSVQEAAGPAKQEPNCTVLRVYARAERLCYPYRKLKDQELPYTPGHQQQEVRAAGHKTRRSTRPDPLALLRD